MVSQTIKFLLKTMLGMSAFMGMVFGGTAIAVNADYATLAAQAGLSAKSYLQSFLGVASQANASADFSSSAAAQVDDDPTIYTKITGTVDAISDTSITIDGVEYMLDAESELSGNVQVGDMVEAKFFTDTSGNLTIKEVELADGEAEDNGQSSLDLNVESNGAADLDLDVGNGGHISIDGTNENHKVDVNLGADGPTVETPSGEHPGGGGEHGGEQGMSLAWELTTSLAPACGDRKPESASQTARKIGKRLAWPPMVIRLGLPAPGRSTTSTACKNFKVTSS